MVDRDDIDASLERDLQDSLLVRAAGAPSELLARGTVVADRYQVVEQIGHGGMGTVYRAYDPELNRLVAVKLLPVEGESHLEERRARMLREAQVLAQVTHPNVVPVHDVGRHGSAVFIAMELVSGRTLDTWVRVERPSRRECLDILLDAGAGLWAAHRRGIAHLDFKPSNAIVGEDGRVRIIDFGLARPADAGSLEIPEAERPSAQPPIYTKLTRTGDSYGTPGYMAPEQWRGEAAGAAADQFAFCVVAYELLSGKRLFSREPTDAEISPPADPSIPGWIHRILARGLAPAPEDRFANMGELLAALRRDPMQRRRRVALVVGALLAVLLTGVGSWYGATRDQRLCRTAERELAGVWDRGVAQSIRDAFARTGRPYANDTAARVARAMDSYTAAWVRQRIEACEATHVRGTQSDRLLDRRMHCLDRRLSRADALMRLFIQSADGEMVDEAVSAVSSLPTLAACADVDLLQAVVPPPEDPQVRAEVAALRRQLDEIASLAHVGKPQAALEAVQPVVKRTNEIAYPAVRAEALYLFGACQKDANHYREAGETLFKAMNRADQVQDDALRTRAAIDLAASYIDNGEPDEAERWLAVATAAAERLHGHDDVQAVLLKTRADYEMGIGRYADAEPLYRRAIERSRAAHGPESTEVASAINSLALLYYNRGEYARAETALNQSLEVWRAAIGPDNPGVANALNNLAWLYKQQDRLDEAERMFLRALELYEQSLGPEAFTVGTALNNLASVYKHQKRYREAEQTYERAIQVYTEAAGPEHPQVATPTGNLGTLMSSLGRYDQAESLMRRALGIRERALGAEHPAVAHTLTILGALHIKQERYAAAVPLLKRALAVRESVLGEDHDDVATTLHYLAVAERERGNVHVAERLFERCLRIREDKLGSEHWSVASTLAELGVLYLERRNQVGRAIDHLERAQAICAQASCGSVIESRTQFALARALAAQDDRRRALELARQAREHAAEMSDAPRRKRFLAEVDAWLRTR